MTTLTAPAPRPDVMTAYEVLYYGEWLPLAVRMDRGEEVFYAVRNPLLMLTRRQAEIWMGEGRLRERELPTAAYVAGPSGDPDVAYVAEAPAEAKRRSARQRRAATSWGQKMHVRMAYAGIRDHYRYASAVLGRALDEPVVSLSDLSAGERIALERGVRAAEAREFMPA